jgi:hypothetical protein
VTPGKFQHVIWANNAVHLRSKLGDYRFEDLPSLVNKGANKFVQRFFNKENSVFKPWIVDSPKSLDTTFKNDMASCMISKIIKDEAEII